MGRFAPRYSREQRAAAVAYMLDQGHNAPATVRAAAAGALTDEPWVLNLKTARYWARRERDHRALAAVGPIAHMRSRDAVEQLRIRMLKVAERLTRELVRQGARAQPQQAIHVARLLQELGKIPAPNDPPPTRARGASRDDTADSSGPSFLDTLAADTSDPEPPSEDDMHKGAGEGNATTAPDPPHTETTTPQHENGVSALASRRAALARGGAASG